MIVFCGLPDDVRHHHPGAHHRCVRQPGPLQGLHDLPDRLAGAGLLPVRAHGLGRRHARQLGRARLRRRHRRAQHRRHRGAGLRSLRRPAQGRRPWSALHPARRAGHGAPLVRLVRLQRRQRVSRRLGHRRGFPQYRHRRELRRHRLARHRLVHRPRSRSSWASSPAPSPASRRSRRRPAMSLPPPPR